MRERLQKLKEEAGGDPNHYGNFIYADDITCKVSADDEGTLKQRACLVSGMVRRILQELPLELNERKTENEVITPLLLQKGIYRRGPSEKTTSTKKRREAIQKYERKAQRSATEGEDVRRPGNQETDVLTYPFPLSDRGRILGVVFDKLLQLDMQFNALPAKTQITRNILKKVAGSRWGLEVGVLSMTHDALMGSLLRYALAMTGAHLPPDLPQNGHVPDKHCCERNNRS